MYQTPLPCTLCCSDLKLIKEKRHIPLLLEWDGTTLPSQEDPLILEGTSVLLAPRYYLKVYHPHIYNTDQSIGPNPVIYKIDKYGGFSHTLQLAMRPSVCKEVEGCYRVEYWYWRKKVSSPLYTEGQYIVETKSNITHTFIKSEYWYIPSVELTIDNIRMVRRDDDEGEMNIDRLPREKSKEIFFIDSIMGRKDTERDLTSSYLTPGDLTSSTLEDWSLVYKEIEAPIKKITRERIVEGVYIHWERGPRPSTDYQINYFKPLRMKDILITARDYPYTQEAQPPKYI